MPLTTTPVGGVQNVALNLNEGLLRNKSLLNNNNIEVLVLSSTGNQILPYKDSNDIVTTIYYRHTLPVTFFGDLENTVFLRYIEKSEKKIDLWHSHNPTFSLPLLFLKKRFFYNFHGLTWNEKKYTNSNFMKISYDLMSVRFKILSKYGSNIKFVAISNYVADELSNFLHIDKDDIKIIPDPISTDFFNVKKNWEDGLIFYPARLIPRKNHINLLKALGALKKDGYEFKLVLTGIIEDIEYFKKIKAIIYKYALEKNIYFPGQVSKGTLLDLYSKASLIPLVSFEETFSLTAAESMATGTPIVASPVGMCSEVIMECKTGFLVDPNNSIDIGNKIRLLLDDKYLRLKIGKNSKIIAKQWKCETIAREIVEFWMQEK